MENKINAEETKKPGEIEPPKPIKPGRIYDPEKENDEPDVPVDPERTDPDRDTRVTDDPEKTKTKLPDM